MPPGVVLSSGGDGARSFTKTFPFSMLGGESVMSTKLSGVAAMVCSILLLGDARISIKRGEFQFGALLGTNFAPIKRQQQPALYWLLVILYLAMGVVGFVLAVAYLLGFGAPA
jgi:hypothetical protein